MQNRKKPTVNIEAALHTDNGKRVILVDQGSYGGGKSVAEILTEILKNIGKVTIELPIAIGVKKRNSNSVHFGFRIPGIWGREAINKVRSLPIKLEIGWAAVGGPCQAIPLCGLSAPFAVWYASILDSELGYANNIFDFSIKNILRAHLRRAIAIWAEKEVVQRATLLVAMTPFSALLIKNKYKYIDNNKIRIVRFGPDLKIFRQGDGLGKEINQYILAVGRVTDPRKNIVGALKAFASSSLPSKGIKFIVAGPEAKQIFPLVIKFGISERIIIRQSPSTEELVKLYQSAQFLVLPSFEEGFGIVAAEAIACGCPVLSTRCGGPEELLEGCGWFSKGFDVISLSAAMDMVVNSSKEERLHRLEVGRNSLLEKYNLPMACSMLKVLDDEMILMRYKKD